MEAGRAEEAISSLADRRRMALSSREREVILARLREAELEPSWFKKTTLAALIDVELDTLMEERWQAMVQDARAHFQGLCTRLVKEADLLRAEHPELAEQLSDLQRAALSGLSAVEDADFEQVRMATARTLSSRRVPSHAGEVRAMTLKRLEELALHRPTFVPAMAAFLESMGQLQLSQHQLRRLMLGYDGGQEISRQALLVVKGQLRRIYPGACTMETLAMVVEATKVVRQFLLARQTRMADVACNEKAHAEVRAMQHTETGAIHVAAQSAVRAPTVAVFIPPAATLALAALLWPLRYEPGGFTYPQNPDVLRIWGVCERGTVRVEAVLFCVASFIRQPHNARSLSRPEAITFMLIERVEDRFVKNRFLMRNYWSLECQADSFSWDLVMAPALRPEAFPNVLNGLKTQAQADAFTREWIRMRYDQQAPTFFRRCPIRYTNVVKALVDAILQADSCDSPDQLVARMEAMLMKPYYRPLNRESGPLPATVSG